MKLSVIGTGYVGLVSGVCFAETGNTVMCVDNNLEKVTQLKSGKIPIYEPDLEALFERNVKQHRLTFSTDLKAAVDFADIIFLALPTPPFEDGSADLSYVLGVAKEIGPLLDKYKLIVDKSTVPIGTSELVRKAIEENCTVDFDVVSNPEFLREGVAVEDFLNPDRVIIGTSSSRAREIMADLYRPFTQQGRPIIFMDERSAEMTKYAANCYLATRISFMNEIANLCEQYGSDVDMVRRGIGSDNRIGPQFLNPGIGYGGSCFPKDVKALLHMSNEVGYPFGILNAVDQLNKDQQVKLVQKVSRYFGDELNGKVIAVWGLSFKPNTDDTRMASSLLSISAFEKLGMHVRAYDPVAIENAKKEDWTNVEFIDDQYDALKGADALCIMTEWSMFRSPDFELMKTNLKQPVIFDGRNIYTLSKMKDKGFHYESIGRRTIPL